LLTNYRKQQEETKIENIFQNISYDMNEMVLITVILYKSVKQVIQ